VGGGGRGFDRWNIMLIIQMVFARTSRQIRAMKSQPKASKIGAENDVFRQAGSRKIIRVIRISFMTSMVYMCLSLKGSHRQK